MLARSISASPMRSASPATWLVTLVSKPLIPLATSLYYYSKFPCIVPIYVVKSYAKVAKRVFVSDFNYYSANPLSYTRVVRILISVLLTGTYLITVLIYANIASWSSNLGINYFFSPST
jgi:hypothetical protein